MGSSVDKEKFRPKNLNGGRPKGARNKRTLDTQALAEKLNVNPLEMMLLLVKGDHKTLGFPKGTITLNHRIIAAKESLPYLFPKLKSVEHNTGDTLKTFADIMEDLSEK